MYLRKRAAYRKTARGTTEALPGDAKNGAEQIILLGALSVIPYIKADIRDEQYSGIPIETDFNGELRSIQKEAASEILKHNIGVLSAPTAFGKTTIAAYLIAERKVNTLVLVHRRLLMDQWHERLKLFLNTDSIGRIGGGRGDRTGIIDVGMIQSLNHKGVVKDIVAEYGQVIVDECHHVSAFSFEQVLRQVKAKYITGLTATPVRKDGHHPIIIMQCGPIRFRGDARRQAHERPFEHVVIPRQTTFRILEGVEDGIQPAYAAKRINKETISSLTIFSMPLKEVVLRFFLPSEQNMWMGLPSGLKGLPRMLLCLKAEQGKRNVRLWLNRLPLFPMEKKGYLSPQAGI